MATRFDASAAAVRALERSADTVRLLASDERARVLESVAHRYVQEPNRRWWWEVFHCRNFIVAFAGEAGRHRLSRLVYQLIWRRPQRAKRSHYLRHTPQVLL